MGSITRAVAVLVSECRVKGVVHFSQSSDGGPVTVSGTVEGLAPGEHGFHIHEFGDSTNGCISAGPHFNLDPSNHHGGPKSATRHNGDLGNILSDKQGVATIDVTDSKISIIGGPLDIKGRSIVIHEGKDDLGLGGDEESLRTGNAGGRIACGVIGLSK